jgi:hypothetical protein
MPTKATPKYFVKACITKHKDLCILLFCTQTRHETYYVKNVIASLLLEKHCSLKMILQGSKHVAIILKTITQPLTCGAAKSNCII